MYVQVLHIIREFCVHTFHLDDDGNDELIAKLCEVNTSKYSYIHWLHLFLCILENIAGVNVQYACMHVLDENHTHASYPAFPAFV